MKSARIITQEIAKILREDPLAAAALKQEFASEMELMTLLDLAETVDALKEELRLAALQIDNLEDQLDHA
jgi:hypothetical protein